MTPQETATAFYEAFRRKDFKSMQALYGDAAKFSDPVFQNLNAVAAKAMWEMLIIRGKDMSIDYVIGEESGSEIAAQWTASYIFSGTGRKVVNHIKTSMVIDNGQIIRHTDTFDFAKWARQALGWKGLIFGHTSFLKNKISATALSNLQAFIAKRS